MLKKIYITDLIAFEKIVVELKAEAELISRDDAQLLNCLKAAGIEVGLLLNFSAEKLQWERMVYSKKPINPLLVSQGFR